MSIGGANFGGSARVGGSIGGGSGTHGGGMAGFGGGQTGKKKPSGAGTDALHGPGGSVAAADTPGGMTGGAPGATTKSTATGDTPAGTAALLRPPVTRPGLDDGTTVPGYGPDSPASGGQVVSALGLASGVTNPAGMLANGLTEDDTNRTLFGRQWDATFGGTPGTPVATRNPIANNSLSRGDNASVDDTRLEDRASGAATAALTGDAPSSGAGTDALFSDVALQDRKKPKSDLAGTNMLLKAA